MLLENYDATVCLVVDRRYRGEKARLEGLFGHLNNFAFFVDGEGKILPRRDYDQVACGRPPAGYGHGPGVWRHFQAMRAIFRAAKDEGWSSFLFVEDDVVLTERFLGTVRAADVQARGLAPWDVLYYGANHTDAVTVELSPNVLRVDGSLTTHMVGFRDTVYDAFLEIPTDLNDDVGIARRIHPDYRCYAIWPSVALQKPGFSAIWNRDTDYTALFESRGLNH